MSSIALRPFPFIRRVVRRSEARETLNLKAGDWVTVRSVDEILSTLDAEGKLDGLPFMPEMLAYCGRRFRVFKSAHKTCDTIDRYLTRRMESAVHLEGLRCDGSSHGGCQAGCLLYWKEAWLRRDAPPAIPTAKPRDHATAASGPLAASLFALTRVSRPNDPDPQIRYRCQATEVLRATSPLPWWEPRQYWRDLVSGNLTFRQLLRGLAIHCLGKLEKARSASKQPFLRGLARDKVPVERLGLQPGELVRVKSKKEIMATLDHELKNRGLFFDIEMVPYCNRTFRVLRRVERLIDEKTGKMIDLRNDCIILDGVVCSGLLSRNRVGCPRGIYSFWREAWLRRVDG
jgi:hypothetical protein